MRYLWSAILLLAMIFAPLTSSVFSAEGESYKLDEIVVTGSKMPKSRGNVTQQINIISEEDIDRMVSGNNNIAELLIYEPGISVNVLSRNDANWGANGGLSQKYNTFMLDGLPVDTFVEPQSLDAMTFERMEVQRGPAAVLYPNYLSMDFAGNQSPLTGTTNIILKERIDRPETVFDVSYGSYKTYDVRLYNQGRAGSVHYFFGAGHEDSDYTDYGTEDSWLNMLKDPEYQKTKVYAKATWYMDEAAGHKFSVFANRTRHSGDTGRPNRDFDHEYITVNTDYRLPIQKHLTAAFKLGYRDYDRSWEEDNFPDSLALQSENGVEQQIVPGDVSFSFDHGESSLLTLGGDFQFAEYETFSEIAEKMTGNKADATQYGLYIQEELGFDPFIFRLGGRYAYTEHDIDLISGTQPGNDDESWDKFLWSAGVKYHVLPNAALYANAGTSFVVPSLKSVGGTLNLSDKGVAGKDGHLPNPALDPEDGIGYDLGIDMTPVPELRLGLRGFYNLVDDQIVQIVVSEDPSQSQDINAGDTTSYGIEAEVRHKPLKWLGWFANYTYTDSEIDNDNDPDQDGVEVPFVPEHMGNVGLDFTFPHDLSVSVYLHLNDGIYDSTSKQNRNKFDSYELLNANIVKTLVKNDAQQIDLYLEFYNLTDNEFEMPWQFQDPGFSMTGGIKAVF